MSVMRRLRCLRSSLLAMCVLAGLSAFGAEWPRPFPELRPTGATAGWRLEATLDLPYGAARVRLEAAMLAEGWRALHTVVLPSGGGELFLWQKEGRQVLTLLRRTGANRCGLSMGEG